MSEMSNNMKRWLKEAEEKGAVYVLDVCDTFDYDHYPIYVMDEINLEAIVNEFNGRDMQQVYGTYRVEAVPIEHLIQDDKLRKLYNYFEEFEGTEEFYVGDIMELVEKADKGEL